MLLRPSSTPGTDFVDSWFVDVRDVEIAVKVARKSTLNAQDVETADLTVYTKNLERYLLPRGMHRRADNISRQEINV